MVANDNPWLDADQQQVWRQWMSAHRQLSAALSRQLARDTGMSMADFEVLVHLSEATDGRVRIVQLAEDVQWERSRLSHHLTRMERRGLIRREECPHDGRGQYAVITPPGRRQIEQAAPGHAEAVRTLLFDDLGAADLAALDRITSGLLERVHPS